ncbi:glycosyltransferase family 4 protein [Peptoniphilus sp. AGMB00490]|uniref:Glycosyltransferase family 4 protein n=2 Tax=Peptoniphilus TaxID=162289 RepID=A0ACD6AZ11_9FIRM|nr:MULTISPECIES: glycosyltransferase family 4 protein [Peptoniphilus]NMW85101.1 glycosyltransferase family 4 protein [Peptoniphilus faecalis]OLR64458.1 glycosyl transferase family 1 [Peptoniphilus porci]
MTKVLHLISGGDTGGAKTHIFTLMKGLNGKVETKIICFIKDTFYDEAKKRGIDIEVYPQEKRSDLSVVSKLSDEINNGKYDLVHAHGARANFICMFLKKKIHVPMITTIHSDYMLDFKDSFYKNIIYTTLNKRALKKFDHYLCVSDNFKKMLEDRGFDKNKIHVLYNGIDIDEKIDYIPKTAFLERHKVNYNGEFLVGIAARLDKVKDHETFIKACKETLEVNPDIIFLVAGEGDEKRKLQDMAKSFKIDKNIYFLGFVRDKYSFFNAIDVNVLTSISESFPYVILEAAMLNVPTISTKTGGIPEIIKEDYTGYLFPIGNFKSLAKYILELYNNREKLKILGENIKREVIEKYSHKSMGERQKEIYDEILKGEKHEDN